jgi:hypothetical protein
MIRFVLPGLRFERHATDLTQAEYLTHAPLDRKSAVIAKH